MFTVCPKCTLTLALTANDLRVGQGYVRCGRCSNVFNALLKLSDAPADADGGEGGPPIAQADPASSSQITRAISSAGSEAAKEASTSPAPAATAGPRAPAASATGPAATPRAAGSADTPARAPPTSAPASSVASSPAGSAATPRRTGDATQAHNALVSAPGAVGTIGVGAAAPRSTPQRPAAPAAAAAGTQARATNPTPQNPPTSATSRTASGPQKLPPSQVTPAPAAQGAPSASAPGTPGVQRSLPQDARAAQLARQAMAASLLAEGSQVQADAEAIDHFELVLKTLGLSLDEDEPPLRPLTPSEDPFAEPDSPSAPTRVIENIVLEGDGVSQFEAEVPDRPLDELDQFARRLSTHSGESAPTAAPEAHSALAATPSARPSPERRPLATSRAARAPAAPTTAAPHVPQGARARGEGGAGAPRGAVTRGSLGAGSGARREQQPEISQSYEQHAIAYEEQAELDDALLDDPMLDEPLAAESADGIEVIEEAGEAPDLDVPTFRSSALSYRWLWLAGCIALALLLVLQILNHWHEQLASSPTWGGAVRAVYADLGAPIAPHWDLGAYEVRQQGAESEPGARQRIRVRFSLANHASRAQPVPLLRLRLLDRYGRRVAERDLTPAEYWPQGHAPSAFLGSDERIDTEVQVRDPSADSASFELDVCLPGAQGVIRCAGDDSPDSAPDDASTNAAGTTVEPGSTASGAP